MITVFTSCYNQGRYLPEAIESVLAQTYGDFEYLIYDDGSTDNTWDIIQSYAQKDKRIRPFRIPKSPNVGVVINQSIRQARGDVWTWCPSDDIWLPNLLEVKYQQAQKYPDAILYSDWMIIDEHGQDVGQVCPKRYLPREFKEVVWRDSPIGFTGIWIPMKTFDVTGPFPEHLNYSEDFYWMIKATIHDMDFRCVPQVLYKKRTHLNTTTKKNYTKILENIPTIREDLRKYQTNLNIIPKKIYFFWANEKMSWMRYMTLYSFRKLNPDWEIELHLCRPNRIETKPWNDSPVQDFFNFRGKDYFKEIEKLDITIKQWDLGNINGTDWSNVLCSSHKSNFFKWQKLAEEGGFYSDLDILYLRPMDQYYEVIKNYNLVICYRNKYFSIGVLGSTANNRFYRDIFRNAFDNFNVEKYQTVGVENIYSWLKKISNTPADVDVSQMGLWKIIEQYYPNIKAFNNKMELFYPWTFDRMEEVFHFKHTQIPENCIGIHWYAGDAISQEYNNLLTPENYNRFDNTYCHFADKILNNQDISSIPCSKNIEEPKPVPTIRDFILEDSRLKVKKANVFYSRLLVTEPAEEGLYSLRFGFKNISKKWENTVSASYTKPFEEFLAVDPQTNEDLLVTAKDIYRALRRGYDFSAARCLFDQRQIGKNSPPSVAFTVKNSSTLGGGTLNVFEYANWLYDLGVDVAVYSDDKLPDWIDVKSRFYHIADTRERYSAITEPVVIVYSIFELQDLLYCCDAKGKVIYHFCQGIEDHHYCASTYESLMAPKTLFKFLFSLPVGRIAVSPHIQNYFRKNYNQKTIDIFNGIDPDMFQPRPQKSFGKEVHLLSSGSPNHLLKGKADIKHALDIIAKSHPELSFRLTVVSGERNFNKNCFGPGVQKVAGETNFYFNTDSNKFECTIKYGVSQEQMPQFYYDSDIYINSSWYEGFGLPSIEAMACGVPVIQADNQGLDQIAADRRNCLLIPPKDPQKMAEAIELLLKDENLRNNLTKNGFETAGRFSKKNQHQMFVTEFEKILNFSFGHKPAEKGKGKQNTHNLEADRRDEPLFSILVPTYNQAKFLPQALDSLRNQTYNNWEAIVFNDGSTDETPQVMENYAKKDSRIRIFHKANGGVGSALNEGLRNVRGQWICWLSSDDLFEPNKLEVHLKAMEENPDIRFFHTNYYILDGGTSCRRPAKSNMDSFIPQKELQVLKFFEINYFNGISVAIHRQVFDRVGWFNEKFRHGQDFDMWLRITALYPSVFINQRTCATRIHPEQGTKFTKGTALYDSPGIYDSAVACLEFLNSHEFPELFPALDLSLTKEAIFAIKNTLKVISNPLSFINRCGYGQALIDRMHEWLTQQASSEIQSIMKSQFVRTIRSISNKELPSETKAAIKSLPESLEKPFVYKTYDPVYEMEQHAERLEKRNEHERASVVRNYLLQISERAGEKVREKKPPLFSIIVPTYNQAQYLSGALDSLLKQTFEDWEAVVVNDGSTDGSAEVMNQYAKKDPRIRIIHKTNGGVASALNEGIKNTRGRWICWLSSDDLFEPDKLEIHVQAFKEHPDIRFFHTNYYIFDEKRGLKCVLEDDPRNFVAPVEFQVLHYLDRNCANGISVVIHREVFEQVGFFDEKYRYGQDFDMWLRINAQYRARFIDRKTVVTRWHSNRDTCSFPEGGFYDSARACIEFLNAHTFSECFPALDLKIAKGAAKAIKETIAVVFNPNAMMYKCYFNTALLERLCEWLCQFCPDDLKRALMPRLAGTIENLKNSNLPQELKDALLEFSQNLEKDYHYAPHDFIKKAAESARKFLTCGNSKKVESIQRYLSLFNPHNDQQTLEDDLQGPLVSVIMPAYNSSGHIAKAIESVLDQSYQNFELIIVDDGSTDNTKEIIAGFKDNRIKYFYKENAGASSARNLAVQNSRGTFIVILDSDDMMAPDFILRHITEFENHPDVDLIYCDDQLIDDEDRPIRVIVRPEYTKRELLIRDLFRCGFPVVPFRTCIRRDVFDTIGFYDETLRVAEDYDMMRRLLRAGKKVHHLKDALYLRRTGRGSLSRNPDIRNAESHFEVMRRFAETFAPEELFPDIAWRKIAPEMRQLHGKLRIAETYMAIAADYVKSKSPEIYIQPVLELAYENLNNCVEIEPENMKILNLLKKCESIKYKYGSKVHQVVM
jgi:glycosyltransferase involved in cell wall biosynthesis